MPPAKKQTRSLRGLLGQIIEEDATLDAVRQTVLDALAAESSTKCVCPECGTEFRAPQPDVKKQLDAVIALLEQAEGKAAMTQPEDTKIIIERPPLG